MIIQGIIDVEKERLRRENVYLKFQVNTLKSRMEILEKAYYAVIRSKTIKNDYDEAVITDVDGR